MDLNKNIKIISECRISGSKELNSIIDLGKQPLANSLKKTVDENELKYPLSISFCPKSFLVQLDQTINKNILFDDYIWLTGTSISAKNYAQTFSENVVNKLNISKSEFIVEIASNDGTFLKSFFNKGYKNILGIDPASNLADIANKNGIPTLPEYMNSDTANNIVSKYQKAKIVIARNVIPHVSDILEVIKGFTILMQDDGYGIIEFHNAKTILEDLHYDSIYHEHLFYFSIKSITFLLNSFDLFPFDISYSPISGGSCVIYFSKKNKQTSYELMKAIKIEESSGINNFLAWKEFANKVFNHKQKTFDFINSFKNKKIVGFGSSARSQTYLNFCGITNNEIMAIIDNNELKHNMFSPGSSIPIISFEKGMKIKPDIIFILAWNFKDEIIQSCTNHGYKGSFFIPFPNTPYLH
ncbi:MAG: hypothetical protein CFH18_00079 [Alphaproteobacteria bacterium MarineAlpha5_Bin8]|nr:MAG: hypothetical protein CFH18_00079 [Alphaproteobacteria bacterium MarineAlpha5_Bin8]PPR53888.1 MAG: hypothetical protein CFH16_00763 [Alphaproteobacteria bacterium MarineAlpha5_Bin6]|tara:strand:- start:99 stop:1334 length:1236 start_codon:yes stop_codon:yes gene_type:complete